MSEDFSPMVKCSYYKRHNVQMVVLIRQKFQKTDWRKTHKAENSLGRKLEILGPFKCEKRHICSLFLKG